MVNVQRSFWDMAKNQFLGDVQSKVISFHIYIFCKLDGSRLVFNVTYKRAQDLDVV